MARQAAGRLRFRAAPMAAAAVWFALGIVLGHYVSHPVWLVLAALGLLAGLAGAALRWGLPVAWVPVAGVWVVLGAAAVQWHPAEPVPGKLLGLADNLSRTVRGHVVRVRAVPAVVAAASDADQPPPPWEAVEDLPAGAGEAKLQLDVAVDAVEEVTPDEARMVPASGGVRVSVYGAEVATLHLGCGQAVEMPLRLKQPERFRDPGAFQYADYLMGEGIAARASVAAARVTPGAAGATTLRCRLFAAQSWAAGRLLGFADSAANARLPRVARLSEADARMLNAMLFGDRTGLTHALRVGFERTGTFHLFVVSGLHIALLAGAVFWALRRLRLPELPTTLLTIAAATAYAALTGFGQPAQRSLVMTIVFLLTRLLSREQDRAPLNALGTAALAMLVWQPASLFDASFQMTVLVVVAIAGIAVPLGRRTMLRYVGATRKVFRDWREDEEPREAQFRLMLELWGETLAEALGAWSRTLPARAVRATLWAGELALVAVVAELVMVLPMALYFHRAAVFALPANMLVLPLIAVLAPLAVLFFLCSLLSPWAALLPGAVTAMLLHAMTFAVHTVSHLQAADVRVPGPVWWVAVLAVAAWAGCCWLVRRGRWGAWATALALPAIAAMVLWPEPPETHPGTLEISALDVGQGDSLLAINPSGGSMLIDAGGPVGSHGVAEATSTFDVGEEVVSPYLWGRRMRRLDVVVLTHAHTDHMGGMPAVLENFRPRELWVGSDPDSALYRALLAQAGRLGIVVRHFHAGDHVEWGGVEVAVLAPAVAYRNAGIPRNDDSLVLRMQLGKASVLLEGDAERSSEEAMLAAGVGGPVTLLKVGHHGSKTSSTEAFVAALKAQDAVVSVGRGNTFGHPRGEVIARLAGGGTHLFRTDISGLTTFLLTPDGRIGEIVGGTPLPQSASNGPR